MLQGLTYIQVLNLKKKIIQNAIFFIQSILYQFTFACLANSEKRPDLRGGFMLCFLDDGTGMDPGEFI